MKRKTLLKIVNPLLALAFLSQALTGIFHTSVMKISYELFEYIHGYGGYVLVTLGVVHIALNWNWIKANFFKTKPRRQ